MAYIQLRQYTCDNCGKAADAVKAGGYYGGYNRPSAWFSIGVSNNRKDRNGDVCSEKCAKEFVEKKLPELKPTPRKKKTTVAKKATARKKR